MSSYANDARNKQLMFQITRILSLKELFKRIFSWEGAIETTTGIIELKIISKY